MSRYKVGDLVRITGEWYDGEVIRVYKPWKAYNYLGFWGRVPSSGCIHLFLDHWVEPVEGTVLRKGLSRGLQL